MNHFEFIEKLTALHNLIRRGYTGTPKELARRLCISRSTLYEIIDELKQRGVDVKYSRSRCTFYYHNDVILELQFTIKGLTEVEDKEELRNIFGGMQTFFVPSMILDGRMVSL
jgi:predicted DNA-binding transcriptional regulator YafY